MSHIWPLKNRENRSVTRGIKMRILKTPTLVCQNSENIYLTFVAYSSNMTSEMTQLTVFNRLCQKSHNFVFKFGSVVRLCKQDLYFYQRCIFVRYVYSRNMNLVCDVALYLRKG